MFTTAKALLLAARLYAASDSAVAEWECADPGSDQHAACVCSLESWRCEAQGWCDREATAPYEAAPLGLPDVERTEPGCEY